MDLYLEVGEEIRNETRGFEPDKGVFNELFRKLEKMRPLYKLRHVTFLFSFLLVMLMRHNWLASISI